MLHGSLKPRSTARPHSTRPPNAELSERSRLLLCLLDELRTTLVLTGVTTSTLNGFLRDTGLLRWIAAFVPSDPIIFPSVKANLIEGIDPSRLLGVARYYRHLALAKHGCTVLLGDADARNLIEIYDTWRTLCGIGDLAMREMDTYISHNDPGELHLSDDIRRLLLSAKTGHSHCLVNGRPEMPLWYQRRHHPRVLANLMAHLRYGQISAPVLVVDVSIGGCGLEQAPSLPPDAIVEVRFESGRILEAAVRWQNGTRAGLIFTVPLGYRDPLISAG